MANVYQTEFWAIKVPNAWGVDDTESSIAFAPQEDDSVALIVSAFIKEDGQITMDEMKEAIEGNAHPGAAASQVRIGDFEGYYGTYETSDEGANTAWRVWCVFCRDLHLYVSFNSPTDTQDRYTALVDDMLRTVMCLKES